MTTQADAIPIEAGKHTLFPSATDIEACKAWFSRLENQDNTCYDDPKKTSGKLPPGTPSGDGARYIAFDDLEAELLQVLNFKGVRPLQKSYTEHCEDIWRTKARRLEHPRQQEAELLAVKVRDALVNTSTVPWKDEMKNWLLVPLAQYSTKAIGKWKHAVEQKEKRQQKTNPDGSPIAPRRLKSVLSVTKVNSQSGLVPSPETDKSSTEITTPNQSEEESHGADNDTPESC
jgi:hypothetical protein